MAARLKADVQSKVNYALVGLFVLILGASLLGVVFWLTVGGENKVVYDRYRVYFNESVAGLNLKATVRYRGVQVGQVESIQLDAANPDRVEVILGIERGTPIRRDTIATLSTRGLTGVASVELSGGREQSLPLEKEANQELPIIQAGPSLVARLDDALNNILTNVNDMSSRLGRLLDDENQTAFSEILRNTSAISGALASRSDHIQRMMANVETFTGTLASQSNGIRQIVTNIETFTGEWAKRSERLGKALDQLAVGLEKSSDLSTQIQSTLSDFRASAQAVRKTADTFDKTSRDLSAAAEVGQRELQRLGQTTVPDFNALLVNINDLVAALQQLAQLLEQNPRALLLGKPSGRPGPGEK